MRYALRSSRPLSATLLTLLSTITLLSTGCSKSPTKPPDNGRPRIDLIYPAHQNCPSWLSGGRLAYIDMGITSMQGNAYQIDPARRGVYLFDPTTQRRTRIASADYGVSCHPSLQLLAYSDAQSIYICDTSGVVLQRKDIGVPTFYLSWSPDGTRLAWQQNYGDQGVWWMDVASLVAHKFARGIGTTAWLADSDSLIGAVPATDGHSTYILVMNLDGTVVDTLCRVPLLLSSISVVTTPGTLVVTSAAGGSPYPHLYRVDLATASVTQLSTNWAEDPVLNRSTSDVAFVQFAPRSGAVEDNTIWLWSNSRQTAAPLVPAWPNEAQPLSASLRPTMPDPERDQRWTSFSGGLVR